MKMLKMVASVAHNAVLLIVLKRKMSKVKIWKGQGYC